MAGMAGGGRNYHPSLERQVFNMRNNTKKRKLYAILLTLSSINVKKNELLEKNANFSAFSLHHELHTRAQKCPLTKKAHKPSSQAF